MRQLLGEPATIGHVMQRQHRAVEHLLAELTDRGDLEPAPRVICLADAAFDEALSLRATDDGRDVLQNPRQVIGMYEVAAQLFACRQVLRPVAECRLY